MPRRGGGGGLGGGGRGKRFIDERDDSCLLMEGIWNVGEGRGGSVSSSGGNS